MPPQTRTGVPPMTAGRTLQGAATVFLIYLTHLFYAMAAGSPSLPVALNSLVLALLSVGVISTTVVYVHQQTRAHLDHRLNTITNALVEQGLKIEEVTGEIPRVRMATSAKVYRTGLDPRVLEIGHRISDKLHAPTMRQED